MATQTTESSFESYVEQILLEKGGWERGDVKEWDRERALFPADIFSFIRETQAGLWKLMEERLGGNLRDSLLVTLEKELDAKGSLHVLRHGFRFYGRTFRIATFKPAHKANYEVLENYSKNRLTVTRQVLCHLNDSSTVDLVLAINGLPVATVELKNPGTGQSWQDGVRQYQRDRNPNAPLFAFKKRALVHFAADTDEVYMTTRLAGEKTFFLPFNRGSHPGELQCGRGNPQHVSGYRTGYFWEDVLSFESFLDIFGHFVFLERKEEREEVEGGKHRMRRSERMIFPRYHQLDAVNRLVGAARDEGVGHHYLIQHSAGSGKTNSISWLSHRLANLHDREDAKVSDCVIVISDRRVLDRQLQDAIYQIEHAQGVVKAIDRDSGQLAEALIDGTRIIITTMQKFPFVMRRLFYSAGAERLEELSAEVISQAREWASEIGRRRYAIIVDEAHSSQTGETARELQAVLGAGGKNGDEEEADWEDQLNRVMESRGRQKNLSFFAFTATPKGKTLEIFGRRGPDGLPVAFHLYSMRQAIEEGFILDVVRNYTTYKTYYRLVKSVEEDPDLPKRRAARALAKFMTLHPHNVGQKVEIIVEHFRRKVRPLLGGRAKGMVVTSSRLHAIRYKEAFDRYCEENGVDDLRSLVAFSGMVRDPETGFEYTEPGMNIDVVSGRPIGEAELPARFASPDYHLLLVANKYQTGFDQPLLCAMYVDKRLDGVQAVQTLSRLNRRHPGKSEPFVLDFVNEAEDIYRAFKPYFDATVLGEETDFHQLEELRHELDEAQVYHWSEVEGFARVFYRRPEDQRAGDHAEIQRMVQPSVDRFLEIEEDEERDRFREKLGAYVRLYAFVSQILPYTDRDQEMLYSFGRFLLPHLPVDRVDPVSFGEEVSLEYYRLQRSHEEGIVLAVGEPGSVKSPTDVGTGKSRDEEAPLSEIIEVLNERFGTEFDEEDRLFFEQIQEKATKDEEVIQLRRANRFDNFRLGLREKLQDLILTRMSENEAIVTRYMDDREFGNAAFDVLARAIFDEIPEGRGQREEG